MEEEIKPFKIEKEDGTIVEVVNAEEAKKTTDELAIVREKIKKLESKDYNWQKLRSMNEEDKKKFLENKTDTEKILLEKAEQLETQQESYFNQRINDIKDDSLAILIGDDDEMRKQVLHHYERIKDEAKTREEIGKKMREAWLLATGGKQSVPNLIGRAIGYEGGVAGKKKEGKLNEVQTELAKDLGITDKDLEKYNK